MRSVYELPSSSTRDTGVDEPSEQRGYEDRVAGVVELELVDAQEAVAAERLHGLLETQGAGVEAEATSEITGCPSARLTVNAFGHHDFMGLSLRFAARVAAIVGKLAGARFAPGPS